MNNKSFGVLFCKYLIAFSSTVSAKVYINHYTRSHVSNEETDLFQNITVQWISSEVGCGLRCFHQLEKGLPRCIGYKIQR